MNFNRPKREIHLPLKLQEPENDFKKSYLDYLRICKILMLVLSSFAETLPGTIEMPLTEKVKSNKSKKHECAVCFKKFLKIENMHLHMNVHKNNETVEKMKAAREEKNRAAVCVESSQFIKDAIEKLKALYCKKCKLHFSSEDICTKHMKQHVPNVHSTLRIF